MAKIVGKPTIALSVAFYLTEDEARALVDMVSYGTDQFLKVFYDHLGKAYMSQHEEGLRDLFKSVREQMPSILRKTDDARKVFEGS